MGDRATAPREAAEPAEESRELRYLRRDVERLSLRLRQEQARSEELERDLSALREEREQDGVRRDATASAHRAELRALEERLELHERELREHEKTTVELARVRREMNWARAVSVAALAALAFVTLWSVL